jgi:hypothetical protein
MDADSHPFRSLPRGCQRGASSLPFACSLAASWLPECRQRAARGQPMAAPQTGDSAAFEFSDGFAILPPNAEACHSTPFDLSPGREVPLTGCFHVFRAGYCFWKTSGTDRGSRNSSLKQIRPEGDRKLFAAQRSAMSCFFGSRSCPRISCGFVFSRAAGGWKSRPSVSADRHLVNFGEATIFRIQRSL